MKTIINKETGLKDGAGFMNRGDLLIIALENPPQGGFTPSIMKARLNVQNKIEAAKGEDIKLENAEFATLKAAYTESKWTAMHKDIAELETHLVEEVAKQPD